MMALVMRALCLLLLVSFAHAGPNDEARALSQQASKHFRAGEFEPALEKFRAANRLVPHPVLDVNIGRCYEKLGQPDQALVHCKVALNAAGIPANLRKAAQQCVDRVALALSRPMLVVESSPANAVVRVDGNEVGRTPWRGAVDPGRRQIDLEKRGYRAASQFVNAQRGQSHTIKVEMKGEAVGGTLQVGSSPTGAKVLIDGEPVGETPLEAYTIDAGSYVLELRKRGYHPQVLRVTIPEGERVQRSLTLLPDGTLVEETPRPKWPGWALVGVGAASVGVGAWFGSQSLSTNEEADELARTSTLASDRSRFEDLDQEWRNQAFTADLLYGVGLAAVAGGVTWLLLPE